MPRAPEHPRTIVLLALGCLVALLAVPAATSAQSPSLRLLVFTKTAAYRHDSIPAALRADPHIQQAAIDVADAGHASTARLPRRWVRRDEWYNFAANPRGRVRVLASLDEGTYAAGEGAMGRDHPIAWAHEYEGGRAWYTGGGHTAEAYVEPLFRAHLLGGLLYAADAGPPRIVSMRSLVRSRRLVVTVRYADCRGCAAQLRVRVRGRWSTTAMRAAGGTARATTRRLPPGRWRWTVVLADRATTLRTTLGRTVLVP